MMSFEEEVFQKTKVDFSSLLPYGFHKEEGGNFYCKDFLRDEFSARIHIKDDGKIYGQVIEKAFDEEYMTFRYKDAKGEFVTKIKEAYLAILNDIKKHCFIKETYRFPQTNRINKFIQKTFIIFPSSNGIKSLIKILQVSLKMKSTTSGMRSSCLFQKRNLTR